MTQHRSNDGLSSDKVSGSAARALVSRLSQMLEVAKFGPDLGVEMHSRGLNVRYLLALWKHVSEGQRVIAEGAARMAKNEIWR